MFKCGFIFLTPFHAAYNQGWLTIE